MDITISDDLVVTFPERLPAKEFDALEALMPGQMLGHLMEGNVVGVLKAVASIDKDRFFAWVSRNTGASVSDLHTASGGGVRLLVEAAYHVTLSVPLVHTGEVSED